ncbi:Ada metal-binding domain-containing protein [Neotabrizicola sp. sgz301269]|uniref:Ada metal-binding domain-containing protein n=1 Tax=Neotabrizicola sp. sgz301269 TaxID=3276282 RepID=UPI0037702FE7
MAGTAARRGTGREVSDAEWQAFQAGAATSLVWAVVTTGIHCRDGCPGRPLRQNLRVAESRAAAEAAGFRACKRCGGG